ARIDVVAAGLEHLAAPADELDVAVGAQDGGVAGAQPAIGGVGLARRVGPVEVARHRVARPDLDLAVLADVAGRAVVAGDADLAVGPRPADGARQHLAGAVGVAGVGHRSAGLGHAVGEAGPALRLVE